MSERFDRIMRADPAGTVAVGDLAMAYEIHPATNPPTDPDVPPLVLLHGGLTNFRMTFGTMLPRFTATRTVVGVEQQAHGRTADIDRPLSFDRMVEDTAAAFDALGITRADVFGYSDGGNVGLGLAIRYPQLVRRLAIAGTNATNAGLSPEIAAGFSAPIDLADFDGPLRDSYEAIAPRPEDWPVMVTKVMALARDFPGWTDAELAGISAPTLIVVGDADIVRPEHAVELYRLIPDANLAILPRTDHVMRLNDDPAWLRDMVVDFMDAP